MKRKAFISTTLQSAIWLATPRLLKHKEILKAAAERNIPVGFQTFPIRDLLEKDFQGTMKTMASYGYQITEMCSPKGYTSAGFGYLVKIAPRDLRKMIEDTGLRCPSCHFGFGELTGDLNDRIEFAQHLGLSQMVCSTFWLPKTATIDDYKAAAQKLNKAAEKIKAAGMQAGFHNHSFEFNKIDNQLIYDALMQAFDRELVKMQFQTEVVTMGYQAADYFRKYPGRFISAHLSDWTADKKQVPLGQGVINWSDFMAAAQTAGLQNMFVEMDMQNMRDGAALVNRLKT